MSTVWGLINVGYLEYWTHQHLSIYQCCLDFALPPNLNTFYLPLGLYPLLSSSTTTISVLQNTQKRALQFNQTKHLLPSSLILLTTLQWLPSAATTLIKTPPSFSLSSLSLSSLPSSTAPLYLNLTFFLISNLPLMTLPIFLLLGPTLHLLITAIGLESPAQTLPLLLSLH